GSSSWMVCGSSRVLNGGVIVASIRPWMRPCAANGSSELEHHVMLPPGQDLLETSEFSAFTLFYLGIQRYCTVRAIEILRWISLLGLHKYARSADFEVFHIIRRHVLSKEV